MILQNLISMISQVLNNSFCEVVFFPILCLAFLAVVPSVLRHLFIRK